MGQCAGKAATDEEDKKPSSNEATTPPIPLAQRTISSQAAKASRSKGKESRSWREGDSQKSQVVGSTTPGSARSAAPTSKILSPKTPPPFSPHLQHAGTGPPTSSSSSSARSIQQAGISSPRDETKLRAVRKDGAVESRVPLVIVPPKALGVHVGTTSPSTVERRISEYYGSPNPHVPPSPARDSPKPSPRPPGKHTGVAATILANAAAQAQRTRRRSMEMQAEDVDGKEAVLDKRFGYQKNVGAKYELEQEIGRGHFGHTCAAKAKKGPRKGQPVAVKVIPKAKMTTVVAVDDVKREVQILKALAGHECVVQFYDAFEDPLNVYIAMELCEGGELLERILQRGGRYPEKDAIAVVRQVLGIVAFCHQQGVVHRDLKPENFLFLNKDDSSPIRAIDFGLSDFARPDQRLNDIVGSAYYIAPEVLHRSYSVEADVWSVGVITYIILCGSRPFWARTESGIFRAVLRMEPNFAELPWPHISEVAKDFVRRLLSKDLRRRPTAAQALTHPWVRGGGLPVPLDPTVFRSLRHYLAQSELRKAALRAIVKTLTEDELIYLRGQFGHLDQNNDGVIVREDLKQALLKVATEAMRQSNGLDVVDTIDASQFQKMDFDEFCAGVINVFQLEALSNWPERARIGYDFFNESGNRQVALEDLAKEMVAGEPVPTSSVMEEWTTSSGTMSFLGFTRLVHGPSRSRQSRAKGSQGKPNPGDSSQTLSMGPQSHADTPMANQVAAGTTAGRAAGSPGEVSSRPSQISAPQVARSAASTSDAADATTSAPGSRHPVGEPQAATSSGAAPDHESPTGELGGAPEESQAPAAPTGAEAKPDDAAKLPGELFADLERVANREGGSRAEEDEPDGPSSANGEVPRGEENGAGEHGTVNTEVPRGEENRADDPNLVNREMPRGEDNQVAERGTTSKEVPRGEENPSGERRTSPESGVT